MLGNARRSSDIFTESCSCNDKHQHIARVQFCTMINGTQTTVIFSAMSIFLPRFVLAQETDVCVDICFQFLQVYFVQSGNPTSSPMRRVFIRPIFLFDSGLRSRCLSRANLFHTAVMEVVTEPKSHCSDWTRCSEGILFIRWYEWIHLVL